MSKVILNVPDISCEHCVRTVTDTLTPMAGVNTVSVDLDSKQVTVEYDPATTTVEHLSEALAAEEYPVAHVH